MWNNPQFVAALATTLTASVAVATFVTNYFAGRRNVKKRLEHVAHDQAVAEFWNEWLKLQEAVLAGPELERAKQQARDAAAHLPTYPALDSALQPRSEFASALLLYSPKHKWGWAPRIPFYVVVVLTGVYVLSAVATGFATFDDNDPEGWAVVGFGLVFAAAAAGFAYLLRRLAIKLET